MCFTGKRYFHYNSKEDVRNIFIFWKLEWETRIETRKKVVRTFGYEAQSVPNSRGSVRDLARALSRCGRSCWGMDVV